MTEIREPGPPAEDEPGRQTSHHVLVLIDDLMFGSKVRDALQNLSIRATFARSSDLLSGEPSGSPDLMIVDLDCPRLEPLDSIRKAKASGMAVLAYGSHVRTEALAEARRVGADEVVPRSVFSSRLPELILGLLKGAS